MRDSRTTPDDERAPPDDRDHGPGTGASDRVPSHRETVGPRFDDAVFDPESYLHFYEATLAESTADEVDVLESLLAVDPGDDVLDAPCGYGRHANALAKRGYDLRGLDAEEGFLERARADAAEGDQAVEYVAGDVRDLPWPDDSVDAAYNVFTSFGYFDDADNRRALSELARVVRPGGRVVVDTLDRDALVRDFQSVHVHERGDDLLVDRHEFDPRTARMKTERTELRDGERSEMTYTVRVYTYTELTGLFDAVGLRAVDDRDGLTEDPYGTDATRLCLVGEVP